MATEATKQVGAIDCCMCGESMPVRENGRGTLNLSCPWCGHSSYAKPGTQAHRIASGWIRKAEPPERTPQPVASVATGAASHEDAPAATPATPAASLAAIAKVTRKAFDMGDL